MSSALLKLTHFLLTQGQDISEGQGEPLCVAALSNNKEAINLLINLKTSQSIIVINAEHL